MNNENYYIFLNIIGIFKSISSMIAEKLTYSESNPIIPEYFTEEGVKSFNRFLSYIRSYKLRPRIILLGVGIEHEDLAYNILNKVNIMYEDELIFTKRTDDNEENIEIVAEFLLTQKVYANRYIIFDNSIDYQASLTVVSPSSHGALDESLVDEIVEGINGLIDSKYVA